MAKESTKGAESLRKALGLLDIVKERSDGIQPADLARESGLTRPTVYRMVSALTEEGFLQQSEATRRLTLGPKLLELAQGVWSDTDLRKSAREELDRLARDTGASALLMVRSDNMATCIELSQSGNSSGWRIGETMPVSACAGGLAMLAYGDWGQLDDQLAQLNLTNTDEMKSRLGVTRSRFYAIDQEALAGGKLGVAAPIFDFSGSPVAAVCLYGDDSSSLHDLGAAVVQAARVISKRRGGYPFGIEVPFTKPATANPNVSCLAKTRCLIGDSPIIDEDGVTWIDILAPAILRLQHGDNQVRQTPLGEVVGALLPLEHGQYLAAQQTRLSLFDRNGDETWWRAAPGIPAGFRYNDGALDARGRIWLGIMDMATSRGTGLLHRYDTITSEPTTLPGFSLPNGIAFTERNDRMLVVDSMERMLSCYRYNLEDGSAQLESKHAILADGAGRPSGLSRGPDDTFFTCHWDGAEIVQLDIDGKTIASHPVPVPRPSGVCFDSDNNRLFVTSARVRLADSDVDEYPQSGAIFSIDLS